MQPSILRMIDANANRAREGLRVMEDLARFVLDHSALAEQTKALRHDLGSALALLPADNLALLSNRDTPGDVGVDSKTAGEARRCDVRDLAAAAGKRAGEALRVIEEAAKLVAAGSRAVEGPWRQVERLRYRLYEVEKRLLLALPGSSRAQWRVCVLITPGGTKLPWLDVARAVLDHGCDCIQLRIQSSTDRIALDAALQLRKLTQSRAALVVNDRLDLALLSGADALHLGQSDLPIEEARRLAGATLRIGLSTHNLDEARLGARSGADYMGVGPMFATATKRREVAGPGYLADYLADPILAPIPHLAIGGVTPDNIGQLVEAGCRGVAVSSVVAESSDPGRVCAALRAALDAPQGTNA